MAANVLPYGFHRLSDIADQLVTDNIERVRDAINEYNANQSLLTQEIFGTLVEVTTDAQAKFKMPGAMDLQPLTELSRPVPVRYAELEYTVAWPIQKAGLALGQTFEQRIKMDIAQFAGVVDAVGSADQRWMRRHVLAALFYNGSGWFHDDPDDTTGELTIKGLANGDTQVYMKEAGSEFGSTDNHYLAQAGDLVTASDPIPAIVDELKEHPINSGEVVIIGSSLDRAKYLALADFFPETDPNLRQGIGVTEFAGAAPAGVPGEFIGYHESNAFIYLWRGMPTGYLCAYMTGNIKPLRMRQHPEPALQGFRPETDREDYPYFETPYVRRAGFGGWSRVSAVVQRFGNASYAIPTGYDSPMA